MPYLDDFRGVYVQNHTINHTIRHYQGWVAAPQEGQAEFARTSDSVLHLGHQLRTANGAFPVGVLLVPQKRHIIASIRINSLQVSHLACDAEVSGQRIGFSFLGIARTTRIPMKKLVKKLRA